jgi:hypothetical protein
VSGSALLKLPLAIQQAYQSYSAFRRALESRPIEHDGRYDLHDEPKRLRGMCGEHGRVVPTNQGKCPWCAGYVLPVEDR